MDQIEARRSCEKKLNYYSFLFFKYYFFYCCSRFLFSLSIKFWIFNYWKTTSTISIIYFLMLMEWISIYSITATWYYLVVNSAAYGALLQSTWMRSFYLRFDSLGDSIEFVFMNAFLYAHNFWDLRLGTFSRHILLTCRYRCTASSSSGT